jgi:hypothetical protein
MQIVYHKSSQNVTIFNAFILAGEEWDELKPHAMTPSAPVIFLL